MRSHRGDDWLLLAARLLIAGLFLGGAVQKWLSPQDAQALLAFRGLPPGLVWPALVYDALAGVALVAGWHLRAVSLSAAAYCGATSLFHWLPDDPWQMTIFVKNWAIAGGCLALAVAGAGRWSVGTDALTKGSERP